MTSRRWRCCQSPQHARRGGPAAPVVLAAVVSCVGGIGGGSILAPILIELGRQAAEVAPAVLASTCPDPVTAPGSADSARDARPGHCHWRPVPVVWPGLTASVLDSVATV